MADKTADGASQAMPQRSRPRRSPRDLNSAQMAMLEERLEALAERLDRTSCGHWGDLCAALLPEVYGEPSRLPPAPTEALPGSDEKIEEMARRHGDFRDVLVSLRSLYHPGDADGQNLRHHEVAGTSRAPRRQQERPKAMPKPRRPDPPASARVATTAIEVMVSKEDEQRAMFDPPLWCSEGRLVRAWTRRDAARLLGVRPHRVEIVSGE